MQYKYAFESPSLLAINTDETLFDTYQELNLTYGKELKIKKWLSIEGHVGLGYIGYKTSDFEREEKTAQALGFPVRFKLLFYMRNFAVGINPNVSFNSLNTVYSGNLIFQYRFKK